MKLDDYGLIFMVFTSIFCVFYILTFKGCATKVVYKDVYVPIKCNVEMPLRPILSGILINDFANALKHSEILEKDLSFCIKGE